ncbi:hypothetical protein FHS96_000132 [Sphingomonas zeicaulis]|uniref:hypothetical protein n=1 Tax=Sphingomonas zeicaulis TaxID=1632740 RepID=UPI003D207AB2
MRGTVLGFDPAVGEGVIATEDGGRVRFMRAAWRSPGEPLPGRLVDYALAEDGAADIFVVPGTAGALVAGAEPPERRSIIYGAVSLSCALFTYMLGPFGILTVIPALVFGIMGRTAGRGLADRTGYYLSTAGLVLSLIALLLVVLTLAAVFGFISFLTWMQGFS